MISTPSLQRRMKICLTSGSFLPNIGGAEIVMHYIASFLSRIGEYVYVLVPFNECFNKENFNYNILTYPELISSKFRYFSFCLHLIYYKYKYNFDLIHVHKAQMGYYVTKIKKVLKVPIILTTHGGDIQKLPEINYGARLNPRWEKKIEYAVKNADLLTAIATSTVQEYIDIGVETSKIVEIYNGVDLERFKKKCQNIRDLLGIPKEVILILSVGRYHKKKGYEYLLKAMSYVLEKNQNVKCLIIGKGLEILREPIDELNLSKHVILLKQQFFHLKNDSHFMKNVKNDLLLAAYKTCDVFVSSSLIEGFSLAVVEAMAAGLPIIATNVSGNEDAVKDGINGFLVDPKNPQAIAEKILLLIQNHQLRKSMGSMSRKLANRYDWEIIVRKYLKEYINLLNNNCTK